MSTSEFWMVWVQQKYHCQVLPALSVVDTCSSFRTCLLCATGVSVPAPHVSLPTQCSLPGTHQDGGAGASSQSAGCSAGFGTAPQQTGYH